MIPVLAGVIAVEGAAAVDRHRARTELYNAALRRSRQTGRPLLVIGDPDAGAHTSLSRAYGCGDVCLDLNGCTNCNNQISHDITKRTAFASGSHIVFVSCVLEYVDDVVAAFNEINRIAGSSNNVFIANVQSWTYTALFYPGAKWRLERRNDAIVAIPVSSERKLGYALTLAAITAASVL